jgi:hypothetical protein
MANPRVRENLKFYPKDAGIELAEAREGSRWLHDLPLEMTTPWIRLGAKAVRTTLPLNRR